MIHENKACQCLWGVWRLWSTLTDFKGNPGLVTCVCACVWVAGLATGLFRFIHTRTIAQPQRLTEWHARNTVFELFGACAASPCERSVKYLHRKIQIDTKIWSRYRTVTSPVRLGMRGPKAPSWDKTSLKHSFKKSHLDLQLRGGSSFRKYTAPFSINIWKRHRPSQLFLHGHFELNHCNYPGGGTNILEW